MPADTPIENRYPWLTIGEERPALPENPTERDLLKAYATMLMVYQAQRKEIHKIMEEHRDDRRETLVVLKAISSHQTHATPMPLWAKVHSLAMIVQATAIGWLLYAMSQHQQLLEHLASLHR